jgi:hypothetical protein
LRGVVQRRDDRGVAVLDGVAEAGGEQTGADEAGDAVAPVQAVRDLAMALFETMADRPWLGQFFMRDTGTQPNSLRLDERIGQQVLRLGLPPRETFHAASAVIGYVIGIATDVAQQGPPEHLDGSTRPEVLSRTTDEWRDLDGEEWPFLHAVADVFATHDDTEQFAAGLDLLLAGLRQQAGR